MIGVADWYVDAVQGSGLRVRQLMMSTMAAESAMLDLFRTWLTPRTVLSSYNGRCYDAPLLKTRYRLARRGDPIAALDHVDLLFPTAAAIAAPGRTASCPPSSGNCCAWCAKTTCRAPKRRLPG